MPKQTLTGNYEKCEKILDTTCIMFQTQITLAAKSIALLDATAEKLEQIIASKGNQA